MITDAILSMFVNIVSAVVSLFPTATELPWGTDSIVLQAIGLFKGFSNIFPPINTIFTVVSLYLGFKVILILWSAIPFFGKMVVKH